MIFLTTFKMIDNGQNFTGSHGPPWEPIPACLSLEHCKLLYEQKPTCNNLLGFALLDLSVSKRLILIEGWGERSETQHVRAGSTQPTKNKLFSEEIEKNIFSISRKIIAPTGIIFEINN